MKGYSRSDRLSSLLLREISAVVEADRFRPKDIMISITDVELSKDLRYARVYYSLLGDDNQKQQVADYFETQGKRLRMEIAGRVKIRVMPELRFIYDVTMERGQRIEELLKQIRDEQQRNQETT